MDVKIEYLCNGSLAWRSALRRLGVDPKIQLPWDVIILQASQGRRVLADWYVRPLAFGVQPGYEFHSNIDIHADGPTKITAFDAGLDHMFNKFGAAVLQTFVYEDYVGREAREAMEAYGARHMLRALGFRKTIAFEVADRTKRIYQLTKEEYDARSTIRSGSKLGDRDGVSRVECPQAAPGSIPAG